MPEQAAFPDITFKTFSAFINSTFSSKISLSTVLLLLFTMTENPDLLSLHVRQKIRDPECTGEKSIRLSAWIKSLSRSVYDTVREEKARTLFKKSERSDDKVESLATKLDNFATLLDLTPYYQHGKFVKLKPVSHKEIQPVLVICPDSVTCEDLQCQPRGLLQSTDIRDIPLVTLIKSTTVHKNVMVLGGYCSKCNTIYQADHERVVEAGHDPKRVYVNSAKYLKIGQTTWVDRIFANAVLNGMYSFHASASAYTEFWNNSYGTINGETIAKLTRRQVWQAFIQESIRMVAVESKINLEMADGMSISEKTKVAFEKLGNNGIIHISKGHACSECTQPYKQIADILPNIDEAAMVGMDENRAVPAFVGMSDDSTGSASMPTLIEEEPEESQGNQDTNQTQPHISLDLMDVDSVRNADVTMDILDGCCMGPKCCAADGCSRELKNHRGGVFCQYHELQYGSRCRMRDCTNTKVNPSQACEEHQAEWKSHVHTHSRTNLSGIKRQLQRPDEREDWQTATCGSGVQAHDEEPHEKKARANFFSPARFYCVETMCKPCGVVVAWTKFAKAESETNILKWLESVYPVEASRPQYICIDKACKVLRTSIANGSWESWKKTTRLVVDSYHYINHRVKDILCRTWCNPAPLNGSAPNLVVIEEDKDGKACYKRAFNTQVSL
jgi:hypothetical protein